jgi:diguanylate cyclase (GGDEF)-like protein
VAWGGLAVTVVASSELLYRLGQSHRAVQEQLRRRAALLDALQTTTVRLLEGGPSEDLLAHLLRRACELLETPHGNLFLVEAGRMRCRLALGATRWMQEEGLGIAPGQGLAGHVWRTGRPAVVDDYSRWEHRIPDPRLSFVRSAAAMPLVVNGQVTGAIVVVRGESQPPFTAEEVVAVERFAELASLVVQNADLHRRTEEELVRRRQAEAELRRKHDLLRVLHATTEELLRGTDFDSLLVAIVHRATALLGASHGNLYLREGDVMRCRVGVGAARWAQQEGVCLRPGEGMVGRVWETGQSFVVDDYATWAGRLPFPQVDNLGPAITVPLRVGPDLVGALFVARSRGEPGFTDEEVDAATRFAHLASLVLNSASLYRAAREELERRTRAEKGLRRRQQLLEALHATTQGLLSGLGTKELLHTIVRRACQLLDSAHGNLYLLEDGVLRCRVGLGAMAWAGQEGLTVRRGEGMVGRVWDSGQPVVVEDYSRWPHRLPDPRFDGLGGAVSVPLFASGQFVGAFSVARDRASPPFSADEVETVVRFGQLASLVLHHARVAQAVEEQRAFYEELLDHVPSDIAVLDREFRYLYLNRSAVRDPELRRWAVGRDDFELCARVGQDRSVAERRRRYLEQAAAEGRTLEFEEELRGRDGKTRFFLRRIHPVVDRDGHVTRLIGYGVNITDRKRAELRLAHLALHDALTGLPNRSLFMDRLQHALDRARRAGSQLAVLFVDLDRFKLVNDTLGHEAGDQLLQQVADRLRSCLRASDTLSRLAGDEFTVLLEDVTGPQDAQAVAWRVQEAFCQPFHVAGRTVHVTASVGIAMSTPDVQDPEDLLRRSDAAMYLAKAMGRNRSQLFDGGSPPSAGEQGAGAPAGTRPPAPGTSEPSRSGTG